MIFDADGVLVRPESWFVTPAQTRYGIPKTEFMAFIHGDFKRCTTGEIRLEAVLPEYLERWRVQTNVPAFIREWLEHERNIDHDLLETIQRIREAGIRCYLGTNQEHHRAGYMKREMGLEDALDGVFASCEVGARKPDAAFYQRVQTRLGLEPHEILFWDDVLVNVDAARAIGWHAEVFTSTRDFDDWLSLERIG